MRVLLLLLVAGSAVGQEEFTWNTCANSTALVVQNITAGPTPVVCNGSGTVDLEVNGTLTGTEPVTNGSIVLSLQYGGIPIHQYKWSLCNSSSPLGWTCPRQPGTMVAKSSLPFPKVPYTGIMGGEAHVTDQNGNELACVTFSIPVSSS
eukprot:TRINITY_DN152_c0_g4_i1.p1 TRINITY_DN152_c0_g4~~TRINITY_DN152_c0_g4_i1.p1  ORF type:complete len:149 (+),score=8.16 TRINITY_DN152_c0_g4_i1:36-482(+)